jgi:folate-binding protein YgfZ
LWLELPPGRAEAICVHLEKYVLADRVSLRMLAATSLFELVGPGVAATLARLGLPAPESGEARSGLFAGAAVEVVARGLGRLPAVALWVPDAAAAALAAALFELGASDQGPREVGSAARDAVRVEEGWRPGAKTFGERLRRRRAAATRSLHTKGCYLGQEIVARLHYRGQVARLLRGLRFASNAVPAIGTPILAEGREAGRLTSASLADPRRADRARLLQRRACELGTPVLTGESAEVVLLPFS